MANKVNRGDDGPAVQGRSRECQRRLRQRFRQEEKQALIAVGEDEQFTRLCNALCELTPEEVAQLQALDESQTAYLEDEIERADAQAEVEVVPRGTVTGGPGSRVVSSYEMDQQEAYARAIVKAVDHE